MTSLRRAGECERGWAAKVREQGNKKKDEEASMIVAIGVLRELE